MAMKVIDGVRYRPEDVERFGVVLGKSVRKPRTKAGTVKAVRQPKVESSDEADE